MRRQSRADPMAQPEPLLSRPYPPSVDDVLATLTASGVLEALGVKAGDLAGSRTDSDLMETLAITYELLMTFDDSGVLDTFFRMAKGDQANFLRWIGSTDDPEIRRRRTETFVSALQSAPIGPTASSPEARRRA